MGSRLDRYSTLAEAVPVFLTVLPVTLFIAVILPEGLSLKGLFMKGAPFLVVVSGSFLASHIGADFGKRLEKKLWAQWGGPPTTRFLRHKSGEYNEVALIYLHGSLRKLGLNVPTLEEQIEAPVYADTCYEACTLELLRLTRDKTSFPLVYKRLIDYGFRRNVLGMKWFGVIASLATSSLCAWRSALAWDMQTLDVALVTVGVVSIGCLVGWLTLVTERVVWRGANRYALTLLEAARGLK